MAIKHVCKECKKEFTGRGVRTFCSLDCSYEHKRNRVNFNCERCGKSVRQRKSEYIRAKNHYCSLDCSHASHSELYSGDNHWATGNEQSETHKEKRGIYKRGNDCHNWAGGKTTKAGYEFTRVDGVRKATHRRIAEKALGRELKPDEEVHHINGDITDNRNENLLICNTGYHRWLHAEMSRRYMKEHFAHI